jgi:hypothetical protein
MTNEETSGPPAVRTDGTAGTGHGGSTAGTGHGGSMAGLGHLQVAASPEERDDSEVMTASVSASGNSLYTEDTETTMVAEIDTAGGGHGGGGAGGGHFG